MKEKILKTIVEILLFIAEIFDRINWLWKSLKEKRTC